MSILQIIFFKQSVHSSDGRHTIPNKTMDQSQLPVVAVECGQKNYTTTAFEEQMNNVLKSKFENWGKCYTILTQQLRLRLSAILILSCNNNSQLFNSTQAFIEFFTITHTSGRGFGKVTGLPFSKIFQYYCRKQPRR